MNRLMLGLIVVIGLLCGESSNRCEGAMPQVRFTLAEGWVRLDLTDGSSGVSDARIRVFTANGHKFAEGETGQEGRGEFPMPPGSEFTVEIRLGDRMADPIVVHRTEETLKPAVVSLSFGLAPCCRAPSRSAFLAVGEKTLPPKCSAIEGPEFRMPDWMRGLLGSVLVLVGAGVVLLAYPSRTRRVRYFRSYQESHDEYME